MFSGTDYLGQKRVIVKPDGSLDIPNRVIKNAATARSIYYVLRAEHLKRIFLYAEIDGLIAGNPPYDVDELRTNGLLHIANFNTLEPRAMYEKAAQSYWNLLFTSESIIDFNITLKDPQVSNWSDVMSRHWDKVVRTYWPSFDINVSVMCGQLVKYGLSPIIWPGESSPYWRVVEANKFFVPDQSASDLDLLSNVCVETEFPVVFLLEIYEKYKDDRLNTKWNIDALEKFLAWKANAPYKDNPLPNDIVELQRKLYQGDIMYDRLYNESIRMISLFYKEGNGTITHYMFHRDWTDRDPIEDGFLFLDPNTAEDFRALFLLFTQSPGEQYIHGNRGLGHKMFALCQAKMMMDNSLIDLARWSSTPIVKSPSMTVKEADAIKFIPGVMTNIGAMEFQQNNLGANLQGVVNTSQYFSSMLQQNAAFSGDDSAKPDASYGSLSPDVFRYQNYKEFNVLRNQISHFYKSFDSLLEQMHIRICNSSPKDDGYEMRMEWMTRCIEDGVPEMFLNGKSKELPKYVEVKATRTAGAGSQLGHLIGLKEIEPLVGTFGKRAQVAYIGDKIKAALGPEFVETYTQDMLDTDEMGGGASLAVIENSIMQDGKSPLAEPSNDQQTHISTHLALGQNTIQQLVQAGQQGQDGQQAQVQPGQDQPLNPITADKIFAVLIPHLIQHIKFLQGNIFAKTFLEKIQKNMADLQKFAIMNRRNAERQLAAQAQKQQELATKQQQAISDSQRKDMIAKQDESRKDFVVGKQNERADKANEVRADIIRQKADAEVEAIQKKAGLTSGNVGPENPLIKQVNSTLPTFPENQLAKTLNSSDKTLSPFDFS